MAFKRKRLAQDPNQGRDPELPKLNPYLTRDERVDGLYDTSQLRSSIHATMVHRDYAAHWFRWGFAARFCKRGMKVLDVGCGQDQSLAKVLRRMLTTVPELYLGVDLNPIAKKTGFKWTEVRDRFNFPRDWKQLAPQGPFDLVTSFEVIEHMPKDEGRKLLRGIHELMAPDGTAIISTPVYNEKHMAANHVHEYRFAELRAEFERAGFVVKRVHGTFMTAQSIKRVANEHEKKLIQELSQWYSWDVLANFLAPKYPEAASNAAWILGRKA